MSNLFRYGQSLIYRATLREINEVLSR